MIPYLYLIASVFLVSLLSIGSSCYSQKNKGRNDPMPLYMLILSGCVFFGWLTLWLLDFSFDRSVLPYSLLFAIGYSAGIFGLSNAIKCGPVALSALISQLSLIGTTVWGFFFWNDSVTLTVVIGLVCVTVSLFLCLYVRGEGKERPMSLRWFVYIFLAFVGNAMCSIVQRTQQMDFDGAHGEMLMGCATAVTFSIFAVAYLRSDRRDSKVIFRSSAAIPAVAGLGNVIMNLFVMLLASSTLSPSLIYPTIGVGGIMLVTLFSVFVLKEKLFLRQLIGIGFGAVATVLLSL